MKNTNKKELKILIIGDCEVGKTSLLLKYLNNPYVEKTEIEPIISDEKKKFESESVTDINNNNEKYAEYQNEQFTCIHSNLQKMFLNSTGSVGQYVPTTLSVYRCDIKINLIDYGLTLTDTSGCRHNKKFVQLRKHYYTITQDIDVILMCFSLVDPISFSNITKKWYPEIREYYNDVPILLVGTKSDIKYQVKYQLKQQKRIGSSSKNQVDDPANTTSDLNDTWNFKNKINFFQASNKQLHSKSLANEFLSAGEEIKNSDEIKCTYCSNLDLKNAYTDTKILKNVTKTQVSLNTGGEKPRAVSIISKVSQQHIYDASTIFFETDQPLEPNIQDINPRNIDKPEPKTSSNLGFISLNSIPKLFRNMVTENTETKSVKQEKIVDNNDLINDSNDDVYVYDDTPYLDDDYASLDFPKDLDGLITSLKNAKLNGEPEKSGEDNPFKVNPSSEEYVEVNNKCINESIQCNNFNLCEACQNKVDLEEKDRYDKVAGKASFSTNTAFSIFNSAHTYDVNNNIVNNDKLNSSDDILNSLDETWQTVPELQPVSSIKNLELDLKSIYKSELLKRKNCLKLKYEINAKKYMQCSSLDDYSIKDVMDTAIELALEYHLNRNKKQKSTKTSSHHVLNDLKQEDNMFDSSIDTVQNDQNEQTIDSLNETTLNESISKIQNLSGFLKSNSPLQKKKLSKKFSNSTEYNYDNVESFIVKKQVEKELEELEKIEVLGIELPIQIEKKKTLDDERGLKKKKTHRSRLGKSSRSLSRCLSCTRANNNTMTSLDKV